MKRSLFIFGLFYFVCNLQAQETLTITTEAGELHTHFTQTQCKELKDLTLEGKMNKDDFFFVRDHISQLERMDLTNVLVDTLPEDGVKGVQTLLLPRELKHVSDRAICLKLDRAGNLLGDGIVITGRFPTRGDASFYEIDTLSFLAHYKIYWDVSEDNEFCIEKDGNILSKDGKILYASSGHDIPEGVEVVKLKAFEDIYYSDIVFPKTVKKIEKGAFSNMSCLFSTGLYYPEVEIGFRGVFPPMVGEGVFTNQNIKLGAFECGLSMNKVYLKLPSKEAIENYKGVPWDNFAGYLYDGIENQIDSKTNIRFFDNTLKLQFKSLVVSVALYNLKGEKIIGARPNALEAVLELDGLNHGYYILELITLNGDKETMKIRI